MYFGGGVDLQKIYKLLTDIFTFMACFAIILIIGFSLNNFIVTCLVVLMFYYKRVFLKIIKNKQQN